MAAKLDQLSLFTTDTRVEPAVLPQEPPEKPEPAPTPQASKGPEHIARSHLAALESYLEGWK